MAREALKEEGLSHSDNWEQLQPLVNVSLNILFNNTLNTIELQFKLLKLSPHFSQGSCQCWKTSLNTGYRTNGKHEDEGNKDWVSHLYQTGLAEESSAASGGKLKVQRNSSDIQI